MAIRGFCSQERHCDKNMDIESLGARSIPKFYPEIPAFSNLWRQFPIDTCAQSWGRPTYIPQIAHFVRPIFDGFSNFFHEAPMRQKANYNIGLLHILVLLICMIFLTGCGKTLTQTQLVQSHPITIPPELFEPQLEPYKPPLGATQKDAALVIEDFRESLSMCNADKQTLAKILGVPQAP